MKNALKILFSGVLSFLFAVTVLPNIHTAAEPPRVTAQKQIDIDLTIPQKFDITRPAEKLTTTYDKYFITGTSNPKLPVYFGDSEIERLGTKGTFGVLVDLKIGINQFTFSQNGETKTVTIERKAYVSSEYIPISTINQASMVPSTFVGVKEGEELTLSCIAPAGAEVTASFDGKTVKLTQVASASGNGLPVTFKGALTVEGDYEDDITQKAGKVSYTLKYKGKTTRHTSTGDVYVAGIDSSVAVRVKNYMGFVYPKVSNLSVFREKLKQGAVDYVKSQDNTYVGLRSGGFVPKERLEIIEGKVSVQNKFSKIKMSKKGKSEVYTFTGTNNPAYLTAIADGKFSVKFFNTTGSPDISCDSSKLFSNASATSEDNSVTYTFTQKNSNLWGYDITYDGTDTILTFRIKPTLGSDSSPFKGITIAIDPGHGGKDKGAFGIANSAGPAEADINLAHSYAVRDLLESMGAKVYLTRSDDTFYDLEDRLAYSEAADADIFVSIHHNSIGESSDANKIKGVEVYYHTGFSKKLADSVFGSVTSQLGRNPRFVSKSYYRVTLSPYAPSILLELGFLSNPAEYENSTDRSQIKKASEAIVSGIKKALI